MKKAVILFLALLCLSGCTGNAAETETKTEAITAETTIAEEEATAASDFLYDVYPAFITIKKYIGTDEAITVPAEIEGKPVQRISPSFLSETNVRELTYSEGIVEIPHLLNCEKLSVINLPSTTVKIGTFQFYPSLTEINIPENDLFKTVDGVLYSADMTTLMAFPQGREGSFKIPDGVKTIGEFAFHNTALSEIGFSDDIETIEAYAFRECKNLSELILPKNLTEIGYSAFEDSALSSVTLPKGIRKIESRAFEGTKLTELYIPDSVTECGMFIADENVKISAAFPTEAFSLIADEKNVTFRDETSLERTLRKLENDDKINRIFIDMNGDNFPEMVCVTPYGDIELYSFDFIKNDWSYFYTTRYTGWGEETPHNRFHLIYSDYYNDYVYCTDIYEVTMYSYDGTINDVVANNVSYQDIITIKDGVFAADYNYPQFIDLSKTEIVKTIDFEKILENYDIDMYERFELIMSAFADEPNGVIDENETFEWRGKKITDFPHFEKYYPDDVSITVLGKDILRGEKIDGVSYDNGVLYLDNAFITAENNQDFIIGSYGFTPLTIDISGECYIIGKSMRKFFETNGSPVKIKGNGTLYTTRMEMSSLTLSENVRLVQYELEKYGAEIYDASYIRNIDESYYIETLNLHDNASIECLKIGGPQRSSSLTLSDNSRISCEMVDYCSLTADDNSILEVGKNGRLGLIRSAKININGDALIDVKSSEHEALKDTYDDYRGSNNLSVKVSGNGRLNVTGLENKTAVYAAPMPRRSSGLILNDNASVTIRNGAVGAVFNTVIINGGILEINADENGQALKIPCKSLIDSDDEYFYLKADETGFMINGVIKKAEFDDTIKTTLTDEEKAELKYGCEMYRRIYVSAEQTD